MRYSFLMRDGRSQYQYEAPADPAGWLAATLDALAAWSSKMASTFPSDMSRFSSGASFTCVPSQTGSGVGSAPE